MASLDAASLNTVGGDSLSSDDLSQINFDSPRRAARSPTSPQVSHRARHHAGHRRVKSTDFAILRLPFAAHQEATSAELEKENRHFSMSEALISAVEEANSANSAWSRGSVTDDDDDFGALDYSQMSQLSVDEHRPIPLLAQDSIDELDEEQQDDGSGDGRGDSGTVDDFNDGDPELDAVDDCSQLDSCQLRVQNQLLGCGRAHTPDHMSALRDISTPVLTVGEAEAGDEDENSNTSDADSKFSVISAPALEFQRLRSDTARSSSTFSDTASTSEWVALDPGDAAGADGDDPANAASSSPESVARGFLRAFSNGRRCLTTPLELVVDDPDVPQNLLPMPVVTFSDLSSSEPLSELLHRNDRTASRLRGNEEWAPPRKQIIFNMRANKVSKKEALAQQNYRCAGCGLKVQPGFFKRFRFCEYLGKFFCPSCHGNTTAVIPARVLHKWDFARYRVSNFARDVLVSIADAPLFDVSDINQLLYGKSHSLCDARAARTRLNGIRGYIKTCRLATELSDMLDNPPHVSTDVHLYTLNELIGVKYGTNVQHWQDLADNCEAHVRQCVICSARGFVCDFCGDTKNLLFPFDIPHAAQCRNCGDLFHRKCLAKAATDCPKCLRRAKLRAQRQRETDHPD